MRVKQGIVCGALMAATLLSACGRDKTPDLITFRNKSRSPDEFSILPTKPLTLPEDLASLPEPTPGGSNITDPTPEADAVAALGGNPDAVTPGEKVGAGNLGLISYASRFGRDGNIRQTLASEDLEWRKGHDGRLLERIFNVTVYFRAYEPMSLDQYAALAYWRSRGVQTVGAPPEEVGNAE
ncbi:DUF3035 domain-containing protein [Frigidibacter sp. RF13]|uniref:DUF3035 domain-containing protein n=1 Tax=Frigidibacter sp. RF13 TaxID=2997340 RepID=UPI00226FDB69|nr:DUF3035 domain-containing protein [Frigidibacter sp. RF13]MCY1128311.1 DUF3035 domain-containing protein [Frigidibacter sp. RF13]